jgi:hypothetical protein
MAEKTRGVKMSVYKKLNFARVELQSMTLKKSGKNTFAGYNYFELGDFLPTINLIMNKVGLCGVVSFSSDLATLTLTDTEDASSLVITSPMGSAALKGCHEVQNIGAVETYQRRYLWVTAMEIVEHDALEATTGKEPPAVKEPEITTLTNERFENAIELIKNGAYTKEKLLAKHKLSVAQVKRLGELNVTH